MNLQPDHYGTDADDSVVSMTKMLLARCTKAEGTMGKFMHNHETHMEKVKEQLKQAKAVRLSGNGGEEAEEPSQKRSTTDVDNLIRKLEGEYVKLKNADLVAEYYNGTGKNFSVLAMAILSMPATSATSERAFSAAGRIVTPLRTRLAPVRLEKMIVVRSLLRSAWDRLKKEEVGAFIADIANELEENWETLEKISN